MENVAVTGPVPLLKALVQQWRDNGLKEDVQWNEIHASDPDSKYLVNKETFREGFGYYNHTCGCTVYGLPEDWDKVASIGAEEEKSSEFKIGDWVCGIDEDTADLGYVTGFSSTGNPHLKYYSSGIFEVGAGRWASSLRKATPEEIHKFLAEKWVDMLDGRTQARFEDFEGDLCMWDFNLDHPIDNSIYNSENDILLYNDVAVYKQGEWPDLPDANSTIEGHKIDTTGHQVQIGCQSVPKEVFRNLSDYIREYDLEITRIGEDITTQITKTAEKL